MMLQIMMKKYWNINPNNNEIRNHIDLIQYIGL